MLHPFIETIKIFLSISKSNFHYKKKILTPDINAKKGCPNIWFFQFNLSSTTFPTFLCVISAKAALDSDCQFTDLPTVADDKININAALG